MTPSQQNLRARILALRITIGEASSDLEDALAECNHESRSKKSESCVCDICNNRFGWWCDNSPDRVCHYGDEVENVNGKLSVMLINGEPHTVRHDFDAEYNEEYCIFCGQPDERK